MNNLSYDYNGNENLFVDLRFNKIDKLKDVSFEELDIFNSTQLTHFHAHLFISYKLDNISIECNFSSISNLINNLNFLKLNYSIDQFIKFKSSTYNSEELLPFSNFSTIRPKIFTVTTPS